MLAFQFWNPIPKQIGNIMDSSSDHVDVKGTNDGEFLQPERITAYHLGNYVFV